MSTRRSIASALSTFRVRVPLMRKGKTLIHRRLIRLFANLVVLFLILSATLVILGRWIDPPLSSVMLQHWVAARWNGAKPPYVNHEWVSFESLPAVVPLAVIAAEDQHFPEHRGFDVEEIRNAWRERERGGRGRGASTLTQQTAKNLFLWQGRDWVRKGLEVWFSLLLETLWSKQRILEVYLNIAEFGPDTFGVGGASWRFFERPAAALNEYQAALLAAVLPNPKLLRADQPSPYVLKRVRWIRRQMRNLGGERFLEGW